MAEKEGFEPSCPFQDNPISSRFDDSHFSGKWWNLQEVEGVLKPCFYRSFTFENRLKTGWEKGFQPTLKREPFSGKKRDFGENGENLERTLTSLRWGVWSSSSHGSPAVDNPIWKGCAGSALNI
jgi:hypothetical protein